ncbi:MAG: glycosyltransferase, partial [Tannerellaceae bacterium]
MENQPLVSIVVITYNSSKYVLETLESAKAQTYQNIELIVTDDCSTDNTVEICREWIDSNKDRFVRTELITVQQNTGVSPNCNRGYRAAQGEWIKGIAGDDILLSNCIDDYVCFAKENTSAWICHSDAIIFNNTNSSHLFCQHLKVFTSKESTALQQYNFLAVNCSIIAPTVFIKADLYKVLGGFDESIRLCEDWPMWLKVTLNGYKFYYINRPTV